MVGSGASRGLVGSWQVWVWCDLSKKWFVHIWGICEVGVCLEMKRGEEEEEEEEARPKQEIEGER